MNDLEPKKLALIRIWQILKNYSDESHPLKQEDISDRLDRDYGITIERKAISRNISLLKEAGVEIESGRKGSYISERDFDDSEIHLLIDAVLCSRHITAKHSRDLIEKLSSLSNHYFRPNIKNIHSLTERSKTDNYELFLNISLVDEAIAKKQKIEFDFNRYGTDRRLHKSSHQTVSPYQLILHNQRYYLMGRNEHWKKMTFYRIERITDMRILDEKATPLRSNEGYENGIDYKMLTTSMPYLFNDKPERIEFIADTGIIDQLYDWFGSEAKITVLDESRLKIHVYASPIAMEFWALQYLNCVEIISPRSLRDKIKNDLLKGVEKYM